MNIFNFTKPKSSTKTEGASLHLHTLVRKGLKITVLSNKSDWSWDSFLDHGLVQAKVYRYIESRVDSYGVERVFKDFKRA